MRLFSFALTKLGRNLPSPFLKKDFRMLLRSQFTGVFALSLPVAGAGIPHQLPRRTSPAWRWLRCASSPVKWNRTDMRKASEPDIHLEADIHALGSNVNGCAEGAWIPYPLVKYEVPSKGAGETIRGDMCPWWLRDGPHYL